MTHYSHPYQLLGFLRAVIQIKSVLTVSSNGCPIICMALKGPSQFDSMRHYMRARTHTHTHTPLQVSCVPPWTHCSWWGPLNAPPTGWHACVRWCSAQGAGLGRGRMVLARGGGMTGVVVALVSVFVSATYLYLQNSSAIVWL